MYYARLWFWTSVSGQQKLSKDNFWKENFVFYFCIWILPYWDYCLIFWQTQLYAEDWIGLKTLDNAGKVKYVKVAGNHLQISSSDMRKHVVPYLAENASTDGSSSIVETVATNDLQDELSTIFTFEGSSSYNWPAPVKSFFADLLGLAIDESVP